jgi:hypothetical protein
MYLPTNEMSLSMIIDRFSDIRVVFFEAKVMINKVLFGLCDRV